MRRQYFTLKTVGAMLILISCSSPKYTYKFDYYDYNSGRKTWTSNQSKESATDAQLLTINKNELVATTEKIVTPSDHSTSAGTEDVSTSKVRFKELTKAEKKRLRTELRDYVKSYEKEKKSTSEVASVNATKQLDDDLKLAIIFGAIGITFAILGGINTVFWVIGVIGLIVGLVFFIRWISTQ